MTKTAKESTKTVKAEPQTEGEGPAEQEDEPKSMSRTLAAARASGRYELSIAYSGRKSLSNRDEVALLLENKAPDLVLTAAERLLGLDAGELSTKYEKLNPGQKRMNGGNRIRAAIKRGDATVADLKKVIG